MKNLKGIKNDGYTSMASELLPIGLFKVFDASPQGINEAAIFRFLQRLSVIFGFCRDCP